MKQRAAEFYAEMRRRRTVRDFSDRPLPSEIVEDCLRAAATTPCGANPHLNEILDRPSNERPFLILVVGYPAEDAKVPVIGKKPLEEIATLV